MVVIGNPPYNAWQKSENDNNKNRRYPVIDQQIRETYVKDSKATLNNTLYDAYVRFFRWATDRLQGRDGIVCFVTNNAFIDQIAYAGMRKHLLKDFTQIYHVDLHGNVRKNPKLSGTTHNVFGIQIGVGITLAVRNSNQPERELYYLRVPVDWRKAEKLNYLAEKRSLIGIQWHQLSPNVNYLWLTEGLHKEFFTYLPVGTKEAKSLSANDANTLFKIYYPGVATGRDDVVYSFNSESLLTRIDGFIENYNAEVSRWIRGERPKDIDRFVQYEKVKWSEHLKNGLKRERYSKLDKSQLRIALYRPFCKKNLYYDALLIDRPSSFSKSSITASKTGNLFICFTDIGSEKPFMVLITDVTSDRHLVGAGSASQCFPYYTYAEDGSNRRENITDWALAQFQAKYGSGVTKWDIFHYVYAMLHHPQYRERYAENLKRDLPHIPLLHSKEAFLASVSTGKRLMDSHLSYEQAKEYPLKWIENREVPFSWRVEKMKLTPDKTAVIINESLALEDIPQACFSYRLGNRSALEWVIDQYRVSEDKRSGIVSDPNNVDDEEYIVRLVGKVITVSMETVRLVNEFQQVVKIEDWMSEESASQ